jgi:hypothetical protein
MVLLVNSYKIDKKHFKIMSKLNKRVFKLNIKIKESKLKLKDIIDIYFNYFNLLLAIYFII